MSDMPTVLFGLVLSVAFLFIACPLAVLFWPQTPVTVAGIGYLPLALAWQALELGCLLVLGLYALCKLRQARLEARK